MSSGGIQAGDHRSYMQFALAQARKSPPKPTNYCVGAVLVDATANTILSTGYTLELLGNTHAEQCCFQKIAQQHSIAEADIGDVLPKGTVLYTSMEPCAKRLSGNAPCVERILATRKGKHGGIQTIYVGVQEPETFVGENVGKKMLLDAGIEYVHIRGLEEEILKVATAGHKKSEAA